MKNTTLNSIIFYTMIILSIALGSNYSIAAPIKKYTPEDMKQQMINDLKYGEDFPLPQSCYNNYLGKDIEVILKFITNTRYACMGMSDAISGRKRKSLREFFIAGSDLSAMPNNKLNLYGSPDCKKILIDHIKYPKEELIHPVCIYTFERYTDGYNYIKNLNTFN